jgi:hypothetical protein
VKRIGLFALLIFGFVVFLFSCSKVNEPTELGDELIPAVDNVNTFDTTLTELQVSYHPFNDSVKNLIADNVALGKINDPVFGTTTADMYFNLSSRVYGNSPFVHPDSVQGIDSVVLQLAYTGAAYGDTSAASELNVQVSAINNDDGFEDTVLYRYDNPGFTTGPVLGSRSFSVRDLKDSTPILRKDTFKVTNVVRIRLDNSLGQLLRNFDTTATGGYRNDSVFRERFRGLAVKTNMVSGTGVLAYFSLISANTSLIVYYKRKTSNELASAEFIHATYSQANSIRRTSNGEYLAGMNTTNPANLYVQSSPQGSYVRIFIPGLSSFPNKIIHRAELVAYKQTSAMDNIFTPPARLLLDRKGSSPADTAYLFENDVQLGLDGSVNLGAFGGNLRSDNSYRFNITRYVQGLVTRRERNDTLRLYAPLRTDLLVKNVGAAGQYVRVNVLPNIAAGRVVLAGVSHPNPNMHLRLRIVYSNL